MVSLFGGGRINKNEKLIEEEVKKVNGDIIDLRTELIHKEPANPVFYLENMKKTTGLIKRTLEDIEKYKKLLKSYDPSLHNFPEIHQLENSIKNFHKMLEEIYKKAVELHYTTNFNSMVQKVKSEFHKIEELWDKHKYNLRRLGILKIGL